MPLSTVYVSLSITAPSKQIVFIARYDLFVSEKGNMNDTFLSVAPRNETSLSADLSNLVPIKVWSSKDIRRRSQRLKSTLSKTQFSKTVFLRSVLLNCAFIKFASTNFAPCPDISSQVPVSIESRKVAPVRSVAEKWQSVRFVPSKLASRASIV